MNKIAFAALALIKKHRKLNGDIYDKIARADYILEDLQDEVVNLVYEILSADDYGQCLASLPIENNKTAKDYYLKLENTMNNLPQAIKQAEFDRVTEDFNNWTKNFLGE